MKQRIRLQDKLRVQTEQSRYKSPKHEKELAPFSRKDFRISVPKNRRVNKSYTETGKHTTKNMFTSEIHEKMNFPLTFIYSTNIKTYDQIVKRTLEINFVDYILNTFLKCKINWRKLDLVELY